LGLSICSLRYGWKEVWYISVEPNEEVRMGNGSVHLPVSLRSRVKPQIPPFRFAPVGMTKGRLGLSICNLRYGWKAIGYTSVEPNEEVRMGNGSVHLRVSLRPRAKPQIPPLRFAPVGMTKGRFAFPKGQGWISQKGRLAFPKARVGAFDLYLQYGWKGFGMHLSNLTRKCEWERAIGIPKA
jgi:hypothetical protein